MPEETTTRPTRGLADEVTDRAANAVANACADLLGGDPIPLSDAAVKHIARAVAGHMPAHLRGWRDGQ